MAVIIVVSDLPADLQEAESIELMVAGANAKASRVAPCLASSEPPPTDDQLDEARLVLVGAVKRWQETGSGAMQSVQSGPFATTIDTRQRTGYNLWPSEIEALQDICKAAGEGGRLAFSVDTAPAPAAHMPWCAIVMTSAPYCSCGADLTGDAYPLFEGGVLSTGDGF